MARTLRTGSNDLEELSYLRSLANYVEYCDVTSDIEKLATAVLPTLCEVIGADSIVLVSSGSHSGPGHHGQFSKSSPLFRAGQTDYPDCVCRRIVTSFGHQARSLPVVQNNLSQHPDFGIESGIDSCILVELVNRQFEYGWLLALNKVEPLYPVVQEMQYCPSGRSEFEFGTGEATLIAATAVLLATHARNADLFQERIAASV